MMRNRDEQDITYIEQDSGSTAKWFLFGAVLGAGLGLLFAPQSGERTRREISRRARRLQREAEDTFDDVVEEVGNRGRKAKARVEEWAEDVADEVREGRRTIERTANSARDELERRLADARARRRAAVTTATSDELDEDDDEDGQG
jgi:gas vesicle protein